MNEDEKESLLNMWLQCESDMQTTLLCEYLVTMNPGEGQAGWLHFLHKHLHLLACEA